MQHPDPMRKWQAKQDRDARDRHNSRAEKIAFVSMAIAVLSLLVSIAALLKA